MNHWINGNFVSIPETTLQSEEWKALTAATRCIYMVMLEQYQRKGDPTDGEVIWSQIELVKETGFSLKTVNTSTQTLVDREWIWIIEPGGRWAKGTTYRINPVYADGRER